MLKKISLGSFVIILFSGFVFFLGISHAEDFAAVKGIVIDDQLNPLPGAKITAQNTETNTKYKTQTDNNGFFIFIKLSAGKYNLKAELPGYTSQETKGILLKKGDTVTQNFKLFKATAKAITAEPKVPEGVIGGVVGGVLGGVVGEVEMVPRHRHSYAQLAHSSYLESNTEEYNRIYENIYLDALNNPLSTFSIDVDTASYANVRRFIKSNQLPPKDAVRMEEMINYFDYDYPLPDNKHPFSIYTEMSSCPWNPPHMLIHIGLQGVKLKTENLPSSNLVFLIDVSGSMRPPNKLPLLKSAFKLLIRQLQEKDRISIVVYAGAAGVILPSTPGNRKEKIIEAIDRLHAGGSTAGGEGIKLAYKVAFENYIEDGNNRVVLATDGDFNVGVSSTSELVRMIEEKRKRGVFLTTLGFGMGNYKDNRLEQLADKGNGNYYYIDSLLEAKKVFMDEMQGTIFTIAKDVKIQVEFNPVKVKAYRLIGYENRMLKKEDFEDDTKDAGELGAGHTVTALYEIIPFGSKEKIPEIDQLKYQHTKINPEAFKSKEIMTIKLRYKEPRGMESKLIVKPVGNKKIKLRNASDNFRFSAALAQLGLLLRDSKYKGVASYENVLSLARKGKSEDYHGYRAEFIKLVETCMLLEEETK